MPSEACAGKAVGQTDFLLPLSAQSEPATAGALGWDAESGGQSGWDYPRDRSGWACPDSRGTQSCRFGSRCREMAVRRPGINVS